MKPHYKLIDGKPVRVGRLLGRVVQLVPESSDDRGCSVCVFNPGGKCPLMRESIDALGSDCTRYPQSHYKVVS